MSEYEWHLSEGVSAIVMMHDGSQSFPMPPNRKLYDIRYTIYRTSLDFGANHDTELDAK